MKTFNPAFTSLEISFRFIFLFFAFIVTCWFYHTLRKYPSNNWSIEQKFTFVLLPMLILFNSKFNFWCDIDHLWKIINVIQFHLSDPLFPLLFLVNSMFVGMLDALFQTSFLCMLLLFWVTGIFFIFQFQAISFQSFHTFFNFLFQIQFCSKSTTHSDKTSANFSLFIFQNSWLSLRFSCAH